MKHRFHSLWILLLAVLLLLASCGGEERLPLIAEGQTAYVIVLPEKATDEEKAAAATLRNVIRDALGVTLRIKDDWLKEGEAPAPQEILVGRTNRTESETFYGELLPGLGGYAEICGKVVLGGNGDGLLTDAVNAFLEACLPYDGKTQQITGKTDTLSVTVGVKTILSMNTTTDREPLPESAFLEADGQKSLLSGDYALQFTKTEQGYTAAVALREGGTVLFRADTPAVIRVARSKKAGDDVDFAAPYANILRTPGGYLAIAEVVTEAGSRFRVTDDWYLNGEGCFTFDRTVKVLTRATSDKGFASVASFAEVSGKTARDGYEYFIPAVLYRNTEYMTAISVMSDLSGPRSYVKETCTGIPMAMLRSKESGNTLTLQHLNPDIANRDNLYQKVLSVNDGVQYGAVGYSFEQGAAVTYIYPCAEGPFNYEFITNEDRSQWVYRYHPVYEDFSHTYTLSLIPDVSESYHTAMIDSYRTAYLAEAPYVAKVDLNTIYEQSIDVYEGMYEVYRGTNGVVAAGIPFMADVRGGEKKIKVDFFVNGFTGAQSDVGFEMFREGVLTGDRELTRKGERILDFWSSDAVNANALPITWWAPRSGSTAGGDNGHPPMLRYVIDGADGLLKAYLFAKEQGLDYPAWRKAAMKVADYFTDNQNEDGSFYRTYNLTGGVLDRDWNANFAGHSKVNTPVAIRFLARVYRETGDERYKTAVIRAADYSYETLYLGLGKYVGGTPDNPNVTDKEAAIYAMYGFEEAYNLTGEQKYYDAYLHALYSSMSWTMTYDYVVTVPIQMSTAEVMMFDDGLTSGFSFIATGHSGIDVYGACLYYDFFRQYVRTGDELYLQFAGMMQNNARRSTDIDGKRGYLFPGFSSEACIAAEFVYYASEDGIYVPWIGVALTDPMVAMMDTFGTYDVYEAVKSHSLEELKAMLDPS